MKSNYNKTISLKCQTCGNSNFEYNESKTWVKCNNCGREYNGGYDELVELNKTEIDENISDIKDEVFKDAKSEISKMLKDTFRGNKNFKLK